MLCCDVPPQWPSLRSLIASHLRGRFQSHASTARQAIHCTRDASRDIKPSPGSPSRGDGAARRWRTCWTSFERDIEADVVLLVHQNASGLIVARVGYSAVSPDRPCDYAMSRPTFLDLHVSQFGWSAVSPSRPAISQSAGRSGGQGKRTAARSHAQPPLCGEHGEHGEHWTLMAAATGATLDQAGCVRTSTSASQNPYRTSGSGKREAHQKA